MDIGIGLPSTIPDVEGKTLVDWAVAAEQAGFSTLGTVGRLVYPNYDELIFVPASSRPDQPALLAEAMAKPVAGAPRRRENTRP